MGAVLSSIEYTKKQKYSQAADMINVSFTPFVVTAGGVLGLEAKAFMRHFAEKMAAIWHKSNSECWVMCVQRCFLLSFVPQICAFVAVE